MGMGSGPIDGERVSNETREVIAEAERRIRERETPDPGGGNWATRLNRAVFWWANHWVGVLNAIVLIYIGGATMAPALMALGRPGIARVFYALYAPFCHQYAFRSWFLFGERLAAAYPLQAPVSLVAMRELGAFVGSSEAGYKIALCQRDVAIYGAMLLTGLAYGPAKRRWTIEPLPLWLFYLFGMLPMLLDGGIQWLSYGLWQFVPGLLAQPFETAPALRALTGALFGIGVVAVGYPHLGTYFDETVATLKEKYGW